MYRPRPLTSVLVIAGATIVSVVVQVALVAPAEAPEVLAAAAFGADVDAWAAMLGGASDQAGIAASPGDR